MPDRTGEPSKVCGRPGHAAKYAISRAIRPNGYRTLVKP